MFACSRFRYWLHFISLIYLGYIRKSAVHKDFKKIFTSSEIQPIYISCPSKFNIGFYGNKWTCIHCDLKMGPEMGGMGLETILSVNGKGDL